jgi:hypothetical protein
MPFAVTESGKKLKTKNEKKKKKNENRLKQKNDLLKNINGAKSFSQGGFFPEPKMATKNMNVSLI